VQHDVAGAHEDRARLEQGPEEDGERRHANLSC
jgi:hypothetical protein